MITEARLLERLNASDVFLLLRDDYGWSNDIGAPAVCGGASLLDCDGRVRIEAARRQLEPRLHLVHRRPRTTWATPRCPDQLVSGCPTRPRQE